MTEFHDAQPTGSMVGDYRLTGAIGQGGEGIVYTAEHPRLGTLLVKEYWPKQVVSRSGVEAKASRQAWNNDFRRGVARFLSLGQRLAGLAEHPGVARTFEAFEANDTAYLSMERVDGTTLDVVLADGGFADPADVMTLADQLSDAIAFLHHEGIHHRDIAPDNIIVTPGYDWRAVLIDFNAAKDLVVQMTRSMAAVAKPGYSPIEQYGGEGPEQFGPWSDLYSTAAVLYRVITGNTPQEAGRRMYRSDHKTLVELAPAGYPAAFLAAIDKAFEPLPENRPASADEWRRALGFGRPVVVPPVPAPAPPPPAPPPPPAVAEPESPPADPQRMAVWLAAGAGVLLLVLLVAWLLSRPAAPVSEPVANQQVAVAEAPTIAASASASPTPTPSPSARPSPSSTPTPTPTPKPSPSPTAKPKPRFGSSLVIFFDWDRSDINAQAASVLDGVIARWQQRGGAILLQGHTDRERPASYSVGLSQRMAASAQAYLESRGVPSGVISTEAFGQSRPAVETAAGVREPMNRRVEIYLR